MSVHHLLLSAMRNLWRNKLHSLINLASLALGLTVFSFAFLYVKQEFTYDSSWPQADRIHRVLTVQNGIPGREDGDIDSLVAEAYPSLLENFAQEIDKLTRIYSPGVYVESLDGDNRKYSPLTLVDPAFADIFRFEIVSGSMEALLQRPGLIAVEEKSAESFPGKLTLGQRVLLERGSGSIGVNSTPNSKVEYEVGAIYRAPANISPAVKFEMITLMHDSALELFPKGFSAIAANEPVKVWVKLKPGVNVEQLQPNMPDYIDRVVTVFNGSLKAGDHISNHLSLRFQPVSDLHFHSPATELFVTHYDQSQVLTIAAIGVLVLLAGCSNSISLSLAAVLERRRAIGIHKAAGALQNDILLQYLGESVLLALLALLPALALVESLLPVFLTLLRYDVALKPTLMDVAVIAVIAMLVGLASGAYPALVLSRVKPQLVLKAGSNNQSRSNHFIRTSLVTFQFWFAVMLMIGTLALFLQLQLVRNQPLGFNAHNLVHLTIFSPETRFSGEAVLDRLRKLSGVVAATPTGNPPMSHLAAYNSQKFINRSGGQSEALIQTEAIGVDAIAILQIPLLAGRTFDAARDEIADIFNRSATQNDSDKAPSRIILNRSAVKALGFDSSQAATDQLIYRRSSDNQGKLTDSAFIVIGVVEDSLYFSSLHHKPGPEGYLLYSMHTYLLKFDDAVAATIHGELMRVTEEFTHMKVYPITFIEPLIDAEFDKEDKQSSLLLYCAGLALFLSCIGLYGLASFTMQRSVKEVGVRKVMGASVASLAALYLWRYARPVLVASALASPIAAVFVLEWIQRFPYQLETWWLLPLCLTAGGTVLVIALLTVGGIIIKAARSKPIESLRYE